MMHTSDLPQSRLHLDGSFYLGHWPLHSASVFELRENLHLCTFSPMYVETKIELYQLTYSFITHDPNLPDVFSYKNASKIQ